MLFDLQVKTLHWLIHLRTVSVLYSLSLWFYLVDIGLLHTTQHNTVGLTMACEKKVCNYYQILPLFLLICIHFIYIYGQSENMLSLHYFVTSVGATFERLFMFTLEISAYVLVTLSICLRNCSDPAVQS